MWTRGSCSSTSGSNARPLEVQSPMLDIQPGTFQKLLEASHDIMTLTKPATGTDAAWFGISAVLHVPCGHQLRHYLEYMHAQSVENRPVIRRKLCASTLHRGVRGWSGWSWLLAGRRDPLHARFLHCVHQLHIPDETRRGWSILCQPSCSSAPHEYSRHLITPKLSH